MKLVNSDVMLLENELPFFGYTQGCYPAAFDNRDHEGNYIASDSIIEHLVLDEYGAFAYVANSRYGWGMKGSTDGPSQYYDREFFDALFGEFILNFGAANQDSKHDNVGHLTEGDFGSIMRFVYYELNLIGDPETSFKMPIFERPMAHIYFPVLGGEISKQTDIIGTARRGTSENATFSHYILNWGYGISPPIWYSSGLNLTDDGLFELTQGNLATWNVQNIPDGEYTLKLEVFDEAGQNSSSQKQVITNNVYITYPSEVSITEDFVEIEGSVIGENLLNYTISCGQGENPEFWSNGGISLTNNGLVGIEDGVLAEWDTTFTSQRGIHKLKIQAYFDEYEIEETYTLYFPDFIIVDQGGSGDYTTIQEAIDVAHDYDTILIKPGNYSSGWLSGIIPTIWPDLTGITITAFDAVNPPNIFDFIVVHGKESTIANLVLRGNGTEYGITQFMLYDHDINKVTQIVNNTFYSSMIRVYGRSSHIEKNIFHNGRVIYEDIPTGGIGTIRLVNNVFRNGNNLVGLYPNSGFDNVLIEGNIFENASKDNPNSGLVILAFDLKDSNIKNNIFINNPQGNLIINLRGAADDYYYLNSHFNSPPRTYGSFDTCVTLSKNGTGNYWDDYDSVEEGCIDSDGDNICDDPYYIPPAGIISERWDHYPLAKSPHGMRLKFNETKMYLISFNVLHLDNSIESVFGDALQDIDLIKTMDNGQELRYDPHNGISTLTSIEPEKSYYVYAADPIEFVVKGFEVEPPITAQLKYINNTYFNYLGYPFDLELDVAKVFEPIVDKIEVVKDDEGNFYIPGQGVNTILTLKPTKGYLVHVYEDVNFTYPLFCSDGTLYDECALNKPILCHNGNLIDNCQECGCPAGKPICEEDVGICYAGGGVSSPVFRRDKIVDQPRI